MFTTTTAKSGPVAITGLPQTIPVGFVFQQSADLLVLDIGSVSTPIDPANVLTLGSDYTVTGGGYDAANAMQTGSISVVGTGIHSVAVGHQIMILRSVALNQGTSFLATGPLTIALLEQTLDKMATLSQQINEIAGRALQFENFELLSPILSKANRINKLLGFDANGNIQFSTPGSGGGGGGGSGTVTSVTAGAGLSGGTITTTGTLSLNYAASGTWTGAQGFQALSGFIPVNILGFAGNQALVVTGGTGAGQSFGIQIFAGTNASDYPISIFSKAGAQIMKLDGAGALSLPLGYSVAGALSTDVSGNVTVGNINNTSIGATTRSTGAFTTLAANGVTSLTNSTASTTTGTGALVVTGGVGIGGALNVGGTSNVAGLLTPQGGVRGVSSAVNASAGNVGEYLSGTQSSAQALTSGAPIDILSLSLTAGDWDVQGRVYFEMAATTTMTAIASWVSSTSATYPGLVQSLTAFNFPIPAAAGNAVGAPTLTQRFSLGATTTVYLSCATTFGTSTATAKGHIVARRVQPGS